ncbi:MAG: hypothetical protein F7B60_06065 [Desulfurococcales archaeon]|nr:hypothetical protein [Desulfurococcales archaeon]
MERKIGIISVILLFMLVIQPLIVYQSSADTNTNHIIIKAEMNDKQTVLHIDSKLYGENAKKLASHNNLAGMSRSYELNIFYNSTTVHLNGTIQVLKNITSISQGIQTSGPTGQGMRFGSVENLTIGVKAHLEYIPQTNMTDINYQGQAKFDVKSNQTGGHYIVGFTGKEARNTTLVINNVNLAINHSFQMTANMSVPEAGGMGGSSIPSTGTTVTAHTYVYIYRNTLIVNNSSNSRTHIKIITDDSADWFVVQGIALMMKYQGANVTMPPMGQLPIVGRQNVTVIIDMSKSAQLNFHMINATELNILNETHPGPFTADAVINVSEDSTGYLVKIDVNGKGDFSNGVLYPQFGVDATYMNVHAEGSRVHGSIEQVIVGNVKLKQEDPGLVFLGVKHAMMKSYAEVGYNGTVEYSFKSDTDNMKFLLDNNEYTQITFTSENATKLPELKLKYNGTVIGGANGILELVVLQHIPKASVIIPSVKNMSKVVIRAGESDSLVIHPKGGIHAAKEVLVNITIAGKHQVLMQLEPGTDVSGDINITVINNPGEIQGVPEGYGLAGPAYNVNANVQGKVMLGIKVDKGDLNSVLILWVHGSGSNKKVEILHPVKTDEQSRMVFVLVPGFSTFIPIMPMTATTSTSSPQPTESTGTETSTSISTQTSTQTSTCSTCTSTSSPIQTGSSSTTGTSGAKSNTGVIAGVILVIIILAFAGYYLAKR